MGALLIAAVLFASPPAPIAGWYREHGERGYFQACGAREAWPVRSAALRRAARRFGLDPDTPVYARVVGAVRDGRLMVERVEQFGSETPVRDCAMDGVVIPPR